jgi:hypothetical protein
MSFLSDKRRSLFLLLSFWLLLIGCRNGKNGFDRSAADALPHRCVDRLTRIIVHDIVSPPVASRMYAYTTLALYEALAPADSSARPLLVRLRNFAPLPRSVSLSEQQWSLAALESFCIVARALVFSKDSIDQFRDEYSRQLSKGLPEAEATAALEYGKAVADVILQRASSDRYKLTRGLPRYSVFREEGKWLPTPPDYADAVEPYWGTIEPLIWDSASACPAPPPPAYNSTDTGSRYYRELMETYLAVKSVTPSRDTIARFWDDNALVTEHNGHLVYAAKKPSPVGHWMGITSIITRRKDLSALQSARIYALVAASIFDGFIVCWHEKYRSRMVRPVTVIREKIDPGWWPLLQTPPFPEYTSGHSVISAAAAEVLETIAGKGFAFTDTTELEYLGWSRSFPSVRAAADEAGISRLYGGIHYPSAILQGKEQGRKTGERFAALLE